MVLIANSLALSHLSKCPRAFIQAASASAKHGVDDVVLELVLSRAKNCLNKPDQLFPDIPSVMRRDHTAQLIKIKASGGGVA